MDTQMQKSMALLVWLGDQLDATDDVQEKNDIGFNQADKCNWHYVRGDENAMKSLLYKYRKQLAARFGSDKVDEIDWTLPENPKESIQTAKEASRQKVQAARAKSKLAVNIQQVQAEVAVNLEPRGYGLKMNSSGRLGYDRFQAFVGYLKNHQARCDANRGFLWTVGFDFNFDAFKSHLEPFGISVGAIPEVQNKVHRDVVVRMTPNGYFEVYHDKKENLNLAYRNAEETSGIIGFDWGKKCRMIGQDQIQDLDEILDVIRSYYPDWNIHFDFDVAQERTRIDNQKAALRTDDGSIARLLNDGYAPLPYQLEGFNFYLKYNGCALNGDDMGLGKTFQTLMYAAHANKKTVVICPKNVRRQWIQEAQKFFKPDVFNSIELNSTSKINSLADYNLVTLNYEIVDKFSHLISNSGFDLLVLDESHRIKNPKAKTTNLIQTIGKNFQHRICLSGTPIKNKKREIFTQANLIAPGVFASESEVLMGTNFYVREKMKRFFFRRTKKQELKDLPEKFRSIIPIDTKTKLPDLGKDFSIGDVSAIKSELAQAKVPFTVEFVEDILENTDSKVIVFSDSDDAATNISKHFGKAAVLHVGATSHEKREAAKESFNDENSEVRVFVATTGSAREGLNLTIADKVVFNDLPWTPADLNQAEARAHRLGQKNCVNVYWMSAENNEFDRRSIQIIKDKMKIYEALINGKKLTEAEQEVLKKGIGEVLKVKKMLGN
jgi:hypothetical protein